MQRTVQLKRLRREYAVTRGMIQELIMKCKILEQRMGDEDCSEELLDNHAISLGKLMDEFDKYKLKMDRIKRELQEIE